MKVALVDYGAGNLHSAAKALAVAMQRAAIAGDVEVAASATAVLDADRNVLPGDGAFRDCMQALAGQDGLLAALERRVRRDGIPFLGICVGMQLLATEGVEHGITPGLGWLSGRVERITPASPGLKVPHMGWNTLERRRPHPVLEGLDLGPDGLHAYFLHSYHFTAADPADIVAVADYGGPVTAIVARDNLLGVQFHPEKSQTLGLGLLTRFLTWQP